MTFFYVKRNTLTLYCFTNIDAKSGNTHICVPNQSPYACELSPTFWDKCLVAPLWSHPSSGLHLSGGPSTGHTALSRTFYSVGKTSLTTLCVWYSRILWETRTCGLNEEVFAWSYNGVQVFARLFHSAANVHHHSSAEEDNRSICSYVQYNKALIYCKLRIGKKQVLLIWSKIKGYGSNISGKWDRYIVSFTKHPPLSVNIFCQIRIITWTVEQLFLFNKFIQAGRQKFIILKCKNNKTENKDRHIKYNWSGIIDFSEMEIKGIVRYSIVHVWYEPACDAYLGILTLSYWKEFL